MIEVLIVIGILAILAAVVIVAINPARQFAQAHNSQRQANVETILNAIGQNIADNEGVFTCNGSAYALVATPTDIKSGASGADLASCLVPTYVAALPLDPVGSTSPLCTPAYASATSYDTCYSVSKDATTGRITVAAPDAELAQSITLTR